MKTFLSVLKIFVCIVALTAYTNKVSAQYCIPSYMDCSMGDNIENFIITGEAGTSLNDIGTGCPYSYYGGGYDDRTAESITFYPATTYSSGTMSNTGYYYGGNTDDAQIFIDFNNDGTFDPILESVGGVSAVANAPGSSPFSIMIPAVGTSGVTYGTFRMRVVLTDEYDAYYPNIDPCGGSYYFPYFYGEVRDYTVVIMAPCAAPVLTLGTGNCSSQIINWAAVTGASGYEYVVNTTAGAPTGAGTATTLLTYTATGLVPATAYYAHVRTNCGAGAFSSWTTTSFTTASAPAAITSGGTSVCIEATLSLSDVTGGGVWSSSNTSLAVVSASGVVGGVAAGSVIISYTKAGCSATTTVTVEPNSAGTITGKDSLCAGPGHVITLSDNVSGGVWSSSNTTRVTVNPGTGVVTGISNGTLAVTIRYELTNTCGTYTATYVVHVRSAAQCATAVTAAAVRDRELTIFPNPNGGMFSMNLSSDIDEAVHVVITNLVGEQVKEFTTVTNKLYDIKLNSAEGIYLLTASTSHGRYIAKVVVEK